MERLIQAMESIDPPPEVADWHWASLHYAWSIEDLADAQPHDEVANPFVFAVLLPQLNALKDNVNSLDPDVRALLAEAGCISDENASGFRAGSLPSQALASPSNATYAVEASSIRLSWDPVDGADHYNVYYDSSRGHLCSIDSDAQPAFCEELATNLTETTYLHSDPDGRANYYWVTACDRHGCSQAVSENPARPVEPVPSSPRNLTYAWNGSTTVVSWDPVDGADHYNVYHDTFSDSSCTIDSNAEPAFCEELATNLTETTYFHSDPEGSANYYGTNYYWVAACNRGGCSPVDSDNPAVTVGTAPTAPIAHYAFEGSTIVLSWEPVEGASHYNIFYDDFFSSSCSVRSGSPSFCEELASDITGTTYTHSDPDPGDNYYWVVACNSSGCSPVDSDNPAVTVGTAPTAPIAHYAFEGSTIVLSWEPVEGASYYNIFYDDFFSSSCSVRSGSPSFCEELASDITGTTYTHSDPDPGDNYYWVVACNSSGCSPVDSDNPAVTVGTAPTAPIAHYAFEGSTIVLSWEPVEGASYYNIFYDDFFSSSCSVRSGSPSFCEELASDITGTTYTHSDPDPGDNYYWVVACNSSGCSPVDSDNPAAPSTS